MLDQLVELDKTFLIFLNNLGSPSWDSLWLLVTNKLTFIPLYMVLLYLMCMPLNKKGIAMRTGHHCTMPLMDFYNIPGTIRASFSFYNTENEVDEMVAALQTACEMLA